jgi:hypothetical protein
MPRLPSGLDRDDLVTDQLFPAELIKRFRNGHFKSTSLRIATFGIT